jgi:hypothetical protein
VNTGEQERVSGSDYQARLGVRAAGAVGILPEEQLRSTPEACAETMWAVASAEVFLLLRRVLGWSWNEIRSWLSRVLVDVLLLPQPSDGG